MPKPIENGRKPLENVFRTPTDCRFWETTAIATHENKERLMYSKGLLLNQIEQMRSYRTFPLVGPHTTTCDFLSKMTVFESGVQYITIYMRYRHVLKVLKTRLAPGAQKVA